MGIRVCGRGFLGGYDSETGAWLVVFFFLGGGKCCGGLEFVGSGCGWGWGWG